MTFESSRGRGKRTAVEVGFDEGTLEGLTQIRNWNDSCERFELTADVVGDLAVRETPPR